MASDLPIEQIGPDLHRHVARVIEQCFDVAPGASLESWCDAEMGRPGRTTYAAFDGWTIVAVASLLVEGRVALLSGAATLPGWRGRGIHTAMVARRLQDAGRWGIEEVVDPREGHRRR